MRNRILRAAAAGLWLTLAAITVVKALHPGRSVYPLFLQGGWAWLTGDSPYHDLCANFQYWPGFAAFMALFTPLALPGRVLFSVLEFAFFLFAAARCSRALLPPAWRPGFFLALWPLAFEGFLCQQSNPLLGAAVMLGTAAVAGKAWWRAAFWLLLPGVVKIGPCCFALLPAVVFLRALGPRLAALLPLFAALPFLLQEPGYVAGCYREWGGILFGQHNDRRWCYRDAWTLWEWVMTGGIHYDAAAEMELYKVFQLLAAAGAALFCFSWRDRGGDRPAAPHPARAALPLMTAAWWLQLWGPSTEIATGALFAAGPALGLLTAWAAASAPRSPDTPAVNAPDDDARRRSGGSGRWLMTGAFILIALGLNGDLEYSLRRALPGQVWFQTLLPWGGVLFGTWLFVYGRQALMMLSTSMPASASSSATVPAAMK